MSATTSNASTEAVTAKRAQLRQKLKALRAKLACTQPELADAIGVSYSYVNLIENSASTCNLGRAEAVVKKAYEQFGAPYEDVTAMQQMTLPVVSRNAQVSQATGPGEVDPELFSRGATRSETARRIKVFKDEFHIKPQELSRLFGVSGGHEYVLRTGRNTTSLALRKKVLAIIDKETARRRAFVPPVPAVESQSAGDVSTAVLSAPTPQVQSTLTTAVVSPATLVRNQLGLAGAIDFDFKTKHIFSQLPDGTILVVKES